jgi:hypothetical protein
MSTRFEANKSKEWFEKQLDVKKAALRAAESNAAMERVAKAEKVMVDNEMNESSSQVTITSNIPVQTIS